MEDRLQVVGTISGGPLLGNRVAGIIVLRGLIVLSTTRK